MAIGNLEINPYLNQNIRNTQFGALTGVSTRQPQQTQQAQQSRQIQKPQTPAYQPRELSNEDLIQAQAIAETFAPQTNEENFFASLKTDAKDLWHSITTIFAEPTQEELQEGFKEIDSYSSLKPENYYANVDSNNEVVPFYDDIDYQLVA